MDVHLWFLQGKQSKRSHCFPPMNREHRKIIHELAEVYGVESVSYDSEPKRNVVITAHKYVSNYETIYQMKLPIVVTRMCLCILLVPRGKSACPNSTLTSLIERETAARAPPPIAHIKQHSSKYVFLWLDCPKNEESQCWSHCCTALFHTAYNEMSYFLVCSSFRTATTWSKMVKEEPVIDYFDVQDWNEA